MNRPAFCSASIAPLRSEPSDAAEMVSQLLFGEPVSVIENSEQWWKVRSLIDNYEGWTDFKLLTEVREKDLKRWMDGLTVEPSFSRTINGEFGKQRISRGSFVPFSDEKSFSIGKHEFSFEDESNFEINSDRTQAVIDLATDYLNTPYLWGGKSTMGIDCSGLVQTVFRCVELNLPRDAYQQEEHGTSVDFDDRQAGDLVFFINSKQKVHHVGILINENEIIHAHGFVRIDDLTAQGIKRRTDDVLSHKFHSIKRLF